MNYLWSPWRMDYIRKEKPEGCIFCRGLEENKDEDNLILLRGEKAFVVMNRFPYNNGHLMVLPRRHCVDLEALNDEESYEFFELLKISPRILTAILHPEGFNIGLNIGKAGGAGEEHLHFHVVPRWLGDTNFMPALGETKIIPEYLEETYRKLQPGFKDCWERRQGGRKP
jgi:ATP adenylyltransferase